MERNLSDRIRERAYEIWLSSGRRDGEAEEHWLAAEREILSASRRVEAAVQPAAKDLRGRAVRKQSKARQN